MNLKLYKMRFSSAHFGNGMLNDSVGEFDSARLFSALFLESLKIGHEHAFYELAIQPEFVLSDAFPYINGTPYLPKPIGYPAFQEDPQQDLLQARKEAKSAKKLRYLPYDRLNEFLGGRANITELLASTNNFERHDYVTRKGEDPYEVGVTYFNESLYVVAYQSELLDHLMHSLQYSGLGGKRTSGYGQFILEVEDLPESYQQHILAADFPVMMSLATSLPLEEELPAAMKEAKYLIKKSSGFSYSELNSEPLRKQDLYKFKAGSTYKTTYIGGLYDVRPEGFPHPVWNYAKGLFYGLPIH